MNSSCSSAVHRPVLRTRPADRGAPDADGLDAADGRAASRRGSAPADDVDWASAGDIVSQNKFSGVGAAGAD